MPTKTVEARILSDHLELLREQQRSLALQISSVERTIAALTWAEEESGEIILMTKNVS